MGIHHFWREHPPNNGTGLSILGQHYIVSGCKAQFSGGIREETLEPFRGTSRWGPICRASGSTSGPWLGRSLCSKCFFFRRLSDGDQPNQDFQHIRNSKRSLTGRIKSFDHGTHRKHHSETPPGRESHTGSWTNRREAERWFSGKHRATFGMKSFQIHSTSWATGLGGDHQKSCGWTFGAGDGTRGSPSFDRVHEFDRCRRIRCETCKVLLARSYLEYWQQQICQGVRTVDKQLCGLSIHLVHPSHQSKWACWVFKAKLDLVA